MSSPDAAPSSSRPALIVNALEEYKHLGEDLGRYGILRLQQRFNLLAEALCFESRPVAHGWNPLVTTGASRALHFFLVFGWIFALLLPFFPR